MANFKRLVTFDRPLGAVAIAGRSRLIDETELAAIREKAYQAGADAARAFANQQLVELRHEVQQLQSGLFGHLPGTETAIVNQVQEALPSLALEIARRLLAGYEPPVEAVQNHCKEVLEQLYPEQENLELIVGPRDAALLEKMDSAWSSKYPGLRIVVSRALAPGDCQVRSRFGLTDARLAAKMDALERELLSA